MIKGPTCWWRRWRTRASSGFSACRARRTSTSSNRCANRASSWCVTRHEQAAAFMAATHGRLTGRPGVCISTLGPGALNFTTGAAYAHLGAMPMIMLTGQKGILFSRQARFQIVDIIAAMRPITKMARTIVSGASIPTLVRDAFRVAMEERPGPGAAGTAGGHRGRGDQGRAAGAAARRAAAGRESGGAGARDPDAAGRQAAAADGGRRRQPAAPDRGAVGVRAPHAACRSSTPRWARARSPAAPSSIWAPRR